jgi:hypothetical protein
MFDELERLGENAHLLTLLAHYARAGEVDRETWQDRLMQLDGARPEDLVRLHGELIAYDWIEQNTGLTPAPRGGAVPQCYRVTPAGLRALRQVRRQERAAA